MLKRPGFSVYLSTFSAQWPTLGRWENTGAPVFLSLYMSEEAGLCGKAEEICHTLADHGFRIIADVSKETLSMFGEPDLIRLAIRLKLYALRIDDGFSPEEIAAMAEKIPVVLNASTTDGEDARMIGSRGQQVFGLHNFYPRPETGLDRDQLQKTTEKLHHAGLKVMAFIGGDENLRGPIFEGLPTLEDHRHVLPSAAFADLILHYDMDDVFVGDQGLSEKEQERIRTFCEENVLCIPAELTEGYEHLYGRVFTSRTDSPDRLLRFQESRAYARQGERIHPGNCVRRQRGAITIDNEKYLRYSGEIQMIRRDLPQDDRVNVIGQVPQNAELLMDCIGGGQKFKLVKP